MSTFKKKSLKIPVSQVQPTLPKGNVSVKPVTA